MSYTMISNEEYHSRDELSASQIKKLLDNMSKCCGSEIVLHKGEYVCSCCGMPGGK